MINARKEKDWYYQISEKPIEKKPTLLRFAAAYVYLIKNEPLLRKYNTKLD